MDTARLEINVDIYMMSMLKNKEAATMTMMMVKTEEKKNITRQMMVNHFQNNT